MFNFNDELEKEIFEMQEKETLAKMETLFGGFFKREQPTLMSTDDEWLVKNGFSLN